MVRLFSIGHSNAPAEKFLGLLQAHEIGLLVDVRSAPYSRYNPQFNRESLQKFLAAHDLAYVYLGDKLGGRPRGAEFYLPGGKVNYELLAHAEFFQMGLAELLTLAEQQRTAFMCSEADYQHCHRYHLITRELVHRGLAVTHILPTGATNDSAVTAFASAQQTFGF